jgi:hypothetical protein
MSETKTYEPSNVAWEKMDKNNNVYLSVKLKDGTWINLFRNNKRSAKAPHWVELQPQGQEGLPDNPGGNFKTDDEIIPF